MIIDKQPTMYINKKDFCNTFFDDEWFGSGNNDKQLVSLEQACQSLINGECDAIRYYQSDTVCAYYDETTGMLKKARFVGVGTPINYMDTPFLIYKDYFVNSKWELIVDTYKREVVEKYKKRVLDGLDTLVALGELSHYDMEAINKILNK